MALRATKSDKNPVRLVIRTTLEAEPRLQRSGFSEEKQHGSYFTR